MKNDEEGRGREREELKKTQNKTKQKKPLIFHVSYTVFLTQVLIFNLLNPITINRDVIACSTEFGQLTISQLVQVKGPNSSHYQTRFKHSKQVEYDNSLLRQI